MNYLNLVKQLLYKNKINKSNDETENNKSNNKKNKNEEDLNSIIEDERSSIKTIELEIIAKNILKLDREFPKNIKANYLNELEFFHSNLGKSNDTFFNKINNTQTVLGKYQLINILTKPTTNLNILENRKHIIKYWIDNSDRLENIIGKLKKLKNIEGEYSWFFKELTPEMEKVLELVYFQNFWNRWLNGNETFMKYYYYFIIFFYPLFGIVAPILFFIIPYVAIRYIYKMKIQFKIYWQMIKNMFLSGSGVLEIISRIFKNSNSITLSLVRYLIDKGYVKIIYYLFTIGSYLYGFYTTIQISLSYNKIINLLHQKLNYLAELSTTIYDIFGEVGCFNCDEINNLKLEKPALAYSLWDDLFKSEPKFITNKGKILKQYWIIKDNIDCLKPYLEYLSYLDVWTSISKWYLSSYDNNIPQYKLALPTYISNSSKPKIVLENFYNLMVDDNSVSNSIQIGGDNENNENKNTINNLLITGANASGKSTCIKAITEAIILGQTICVVPAKTMELTPFEMINTYLNIPDCQGKESLFQAEMSRCYQQINQLKELDESNFSFSIMDEIFVSTNYFEGVAGAYAIAKKMSRFPNSICLITTHFPVLTNVFNKNQCFKNYHFPIKRSEGGEITKTYKLEAGESKQHLAIKLLENKGFDDDIIKDAKKMYNYLLKKDKARVKKQGKKKKKKT